MHFHGSQVLAGFPIPEPELAIAVARCQKLSIRGEIQPAGVARVQVPTELLFAVHLEVTFAVVDHYFVVHGLAREILSIRMHCGRWDSLHIRLTNVFGYDWDAKFPKEDLFIISC